MPKRRAPKAKAKKRRLKWSDAEEEEAHYET
jgi:hypothetical protein